MAPVDQETILWMGYRQELGFLKTHGSRCLICKLAGMINKVSFVGCLLACSVLRHINPFRVI